MKNYQFLVAAILLVLIQTAWGYENPYLSISTQNSKQLSENSSRTGQNSSPVDIDFFKIVNNAPESNESFPIADTEVVFSCPQNNGEIPWVVSLWVHYKVSSGKADEQLKGYDILPAQCANGFSMSIDKNEQKENIVEAYYIGIQSYCTNTPPDGFRRGKSLTEGWSCDTSDYKLKLGAIPKAIVVDTNILTISELKNAISLGTIKTGKIQSADEKNVYAVETYSTANTAGTDEVPLLFSCTSAAARYTNDWKLTVYDDKNTVVTGYPRYINGSDCGSTLVDDKGGFKFTLPKDSPRYFVSVQSACDSQSKKNCTVEASQYNIARDVTKIYTGSLSATKTITENTASFKLIRCGLNANSTIAVKIENADLRAMFKNKIPMKIQIGMTACQILTPDSFSPAELMLGSITGNAEIIDASLTAKDSINVSLGECTPSNKPENEKAIKVTLTGAKLDLDNLNPAAISTIPTTTTTTAPANNSVVIPVKVDVGDFHCEGREAFYIDTDKPKVGDKTYSNRLFIDAENYSTPINLELSKTDKIESVTDVRLYYVDSSINNDTVLNFSCDTSTRFSNNWKVTVYNNDKTLFGTPYIINGSDCATGKEGDNGGYKITIPKDKNSARYFVTVKSTCDENDSACVVDKSPYILSREITAETSTGKTVTTTTPVITSDSFNSTWLATKTNLGATLQTGQISNVTDTKIYQIDTGTEDANLTFSCGNSRPFQNDWKILIYDSTKNLKSTTIINGSSCATTTGYALSLTKESPTYYLVVKSVCDVDDKTCAVDKSQYQLKRITATQAATNATATKPCFGTNCTTTTTVKPFFK